MIKVLTGKYRKHIAWLLFFVFYGELAASLYAGGRMGSYCPLYPISAVQIYDQFPGKRFPAEDIKATLRTDDLIKSEAAPVPPTEISQGKDEKGDKNFIGGPGQPEMNTFKSIGADNMVSLFTGDFNYNIPLLDVGGYPINIFYNAGITMDQEASWVGLGWNINPGTISRNMRGLPDDYNGEDSITKVQSIRRDITVGVTGSTGMEAVGIPGLGININAGIFYNNRRGLGLEAGVGFDYSSQKLMSNNASTEKTLKDTTRAITLGGSLGINLNSQNGMSVNGGFSIYQFNKDKLSQIGLSTSVDYSSRQGLTDLKIDAEFSRYKIAPVEDKETKKISYFFSGTASGSVNVSNINFARSSFTPSIRMPLTRFNQMYSVKLGQESKVFFQSGRIGGYVNETRIDVNDKTQKKPAYGYMYYEAANEDGNALLDFNRLNDGVYTYKKPVIDLPVYTYDIFNISGEGTGGSFRGYRGNMGYMRDHYSKTKTGSFSISLDLGGGDLVHAGAILGGVYSPSYVNEWKYSNLMRQTAAFKETDGLYQTFYFKNPGEKAIIDEAYYDKMGGDQLIRPYLGNTGTSTPNLQTGFQVFDQDKKVERTIPVTAGDTYRKIRDKRTQVITYLTAKDADLIGLDKEIYSYSQNSFKPGSCNTPGIVTKIKRYNPDDPTFYRKAHHISEVDVLESDGRRYVYGIPVYQIKQKEVTFSTENSPGSQDQLVLYNPASDATVNNNKGRDGLYQSETVNGYAHSYLLSGILSPDYVDVTEDGITDDDLGTAIRFNYTRVNKKRHSFFGANYWNAFKWRMPAGANMANYNEGLKADNRDNKGLYTYGEKELWYLHSVESKNMVATFIVSGIRSDGKQVVNEHGGLSDDTLGQKKLVRIDLYTKSDYLKSANPRPVKSVHFDYDYSTCPNFSFNDGKPVDKNGNIVTPGSDDNVNKGKGKLTLKAIWFSYNGNSNQVKNKYVFKYAEKIVSTVNVLNPGYNSAENDRWGNYKPHSANPAQAINNDYAYTLQDADKSNEYASVWNLEKILLPGGAVLKVEYESDDYAFVQDKRASQMTPVAGFGKDANAKPSQVSNELYKWNAADAGSPGLMDYRFVFFDIGQPLQTKTEIYERYLKDFKQLLLRLWVKMPKGNVGNQPAYEPVVVYGSIKDYNFAKKEDGSTDNNRFYVELEPTRKGGSPIMETVLQFLKDQLPGRAYPGYEVNGDGALLQIIRSVFGLVSAYTQGVLGFERELKILGKCKQVQLNMSFARLNNPSFRKFGGGHRVKKVTINDNWNRMTNQYESQYGQVYNYTTTEFVNGETNVISSGVATYEPGVGNEENPFREVLKYSEKQFLGPTDHSNVELPVAEMFFPSPMVGYSRVTVRSIHRNKNNSKIKSGIGFQQTEFYTSRDFPVISDFTSFDPDSRHHHKPSTIARIFNFKKKDYMTLTQGFRVVLNDMNGKLKSQTSYAENDSITPVNYTANYYRIVSRGDNKYKLDNVIPVVSGPDGKIANKLVGRDIEVMNDFREHFSYTYSANIPLNGEFFMVGPFPVIIPTIFRMAFRDESMYRSATTLKVVNEYGILDSVVNIDKGSLVGTRNMIYDAESGDALVSRTNNEFNKPIYQFNYPAWWVHSGMEPAYRNIDLTYKGILFRNGKIEGYPEGFSIDNFESGDEIYVTYDGTTGPPETAGCIAGNYPWTIAPSTAYRIWALDLRKDLRNTQKEFIFIDREGNPYNAVNATIRIVRSGKRNLQSASVGSIVSMNNPVRTISGEQWIVIDSNSNVINAAAAEFKERWRANDMFYAVDTVVRTVRRTPISNTTIAADETHSFGEYYTRGDRYLDNIPESDHFAAEQYDGSGGGRDFRYKSWVKFNFGGFSANNTILSANLRLFSHKTSFHEYIIHKNDGQAYCPDNSPIYGPDRHVSNDPHVSRIEHENDFVLTRMFAPWPAEEDCAAWTSQYRFDAPSGNMNVKTVDGTSPYSSVLDYTIPATDLVKGMIRDISKNYATALRINLRQESGNKPPARVCFWGTAPIMTKSLSVPNYPRTPPRIEIKYYNCDISNPVVYSGPIDNAPVTPPADSMYCISDTIQKLCFSVFSKKQMNPYIEGVLGNWRGWKSYVYYGDRRETDVTASTNIVKDGVIRNFEPYWAFAATPDLKLTKTNIDDWVWNAEITQYNRKGAELENRDPLGRYNAGIYGYQESLPVAVVNNSRLRLSAFDGFEDYSYQDDPCEPYCKPSKRHFNAGVTGSLLDLTESHTGRYSVKIAANATHQINVKVSADDDITDPDIRIKHVSTPYTTVVSVTPKGIGLQGNYYNSTDFSGPVNVRSPEYVDLAFRPVGANGCSNRDYDDPPSGTRCRNMSVEWKGFIQVIHSGNYEFDLPGTDDEGYVNIVVNSTSYPVVTNIWGGTQTRSSIFLAAGTLHPITVRYKQYNGNGKILLLWKQPGSSSFTRIDKKHLYPFDQESLGNGTTETDTVYCVKPDTIQAVNHHLIDSFNLVTGKKMVASVWMKKGGQDCKCDAYNNSFAIRDSLGGLIASFVPKERIIEGWQQFEAIFTVPENHTKIVFDFKAPADAVAYIDDLRIHPFNANMKSFVYDHITLRLASELDENNYASFYEYDDDGGLIRVKKETRLGIKTITETRSAVQKRITDL